MEKFITLISQLPCLWDMECREYRDMRKKHAAWKRVVQELKSKEIPDVQTAKAEWKKLRDSHRDSLKRVKAIGAIAQDDDFPRVNKWKYAEHMAFLVPYMKTRKRGRNLSGIIDDDADDSPASPSESFLAVPSTSNDDNIGFSPESNSQNNADPIQEIEHKYRKRKIDDDFGEIMIDMEDRSRYTSRSSHPLDSFFESMCETTKQFPTWLQYSVKRIYNIKYLMLYLKQKIHLKATNLENLYSDCIIV